MVASVFHAFKHAFKACFLGWHFLTRNISPRWPCFLSDLALGLYEDWRGYINRTIYSEFSSGFIWELQGLHQWNYPYSELLRSHCLYLSTGSVRGLKELQHVISEVAFHLLRGMSDSQQYPINHCPDNNEVDTLMCIAEDWVSGDSRLQCTW